ncbi:MAG: RNA-binding S4 domain-containing protein [Candidatus Coatesbacteria bacterium]|nr:RNA-binding S4 domain-containing protein [Candidatus Coatesbacteria bacterium]
MRLDKFLKVSRIIKRRPLAKQACDGGKVKVNGNTADAGKQLKVGDVIAVSLGRIRLTVRVERLAKTVRKSEADELYSILEREDSGADPLGF